MKLRTVLSTAALLGLSAAAFGASPAPAAGSTGAPGGVHGYCAKNLDQCQQLAAKFDQWCTTNADKCVSLKALVEKRRERCEANKEKCEEIMERIHERNEARRGQSDGSSGSPSTD